MLSPTTPIDLVIFDCDGVLIDSEDISAGVLVELAGEAGIVFDVGYVREHFLGRSFPTVAHFIRKNFAKALPSDFEASYRTRLLQRFESDLRPTAGVLDVLRQLALPACVATSSSAPRAARSLAIAGLDGFFEHVFTANLVAKGKPAPDLFLHAASTVGVEPERCLVIEDSQPGLIAAMAAGMQVAHFIGGSHLRHLRSAPSTDASRRSFESWTELTSAFPSLVRPACAGLAP